MLDKDLKDLKPPRHWAVILLVRTLIVLAVIFVVGVFITLSNEHPMTILAILAIGLVALFHKSHHKGE
jgi:uncharacterized membrane protein YoaK (UPF0700 family)